jgi:hypothetical protein
MTMAGNDRDDDPPFGAPQWVESFDVVHQQVSALLDSWASAKVDALMGDVYALLDDGGPHSR